MESENKNDQKKFNLNEYDINNNINNPDKEKISKLNSSLQTILDNRKYRYQNISDYLEQLPKLNKIFKKLKKYGLDYIHFPNIKYTNEITLNNGKKIWLYEILDYNESKKDNTKFYEKKYKIATFINDTSLLKEYMIYRQLQKNKKVLLSLYFTCFAAIVSIGLLLGFSSKAAELALFKYNLYLSILSGITLDAINTIYQNIKYQKLVKICSNKGTELSKLLEINDITDLTNEQVIEKFNKSEYQNTLEYKTNEKAREEKEITETEKNIKEYVIKLIKFQEKLQDLKHKEKSFQRITVPEEYFFYTIENNKKIREEFLENNRLKYIDLILFNFDNADVRGVDFRNTNAIINPQTVYNKDISRCNFDGIDLGILTDFNGVNITGTSFKKINGIGTLLPPNIDEIAYKDNINQKGRNK